MQLDALLKEIFIKQSLSYAILSGKSRITIRPIKLQQRFCYQVTTQEGPQAFHQNLSPEECLQFLHTHLQLPCKQALLRTAHAEYQILIGKKSVKIIHKTISQPPSSSLLHNRKKNYILDENIPIPFLIALGVMNEKGRIIPKKRNKFKQLNKFLEIIEETLPRMRPDKKLRIIDFGCGKAYLTFALYHYLKEMGREVEIQGLDLKSEVISFCKEVAEKLGFEQLKFSVGDIAHFKPADEVDMVITLHACDTATDDAIQKAVEWKTDVILSVPCCQHELFSQIDCVDLKPILKHGILKERLAALATDAARAHVLEILGYQTQVMEFIDLEHTPKNLLIRAIKKESNEVNRQKLLKEEYSKFKTLLQITPKIECLLLE